MVEDADGPEREACPTMEAVPGNPAELRRKRRNARRARNAAAAKRGIAPRTTIATAPQAPAASPANPSDPEPFVLTEESLESALVALVAPFEPSEPVSSAAAPDIAPAADEAPVVPEPPPIAPAASLDPIAFDLAPAAASEPDAASALAAEEDPDSDPTTAMMPAALLPVRPAIRYLPAAFVVGAVLLTVGLFSGMGLSTAAIHVPESVAETSAPTASRTPPLPLVQARLLPPAEAATTAPVAVSMALGTENLPLAAALGPTARERVTARDATARTAQAPRKPKEAAKPAPTRAASAEPREEGSLWDALKRVIDR